MTTPVHFSCRLCRTQYVAPRTVCPACTDADTYTLTVRVRHLLGLRRNVSDSRARLHVDHLAAAGAA